MLRAAAVEVKNTLPLLENPRHGEAEGEEDDDAVCIDGLSDASYQYHENALAADLRRRLQAFGTYVTIPAFPAIWYDGPLSPSRAPQKS